MYTGSKVLVADTLGRLDPCLGQTFPGTYCTLRSDVHTVTVESGFRERKWSEVRWSSGQD
jgi:hypothetical protein